MDNNFIIAIKLSRLCAGESRGFRVVRLSVNVNTISHSICYEPAQTRLSAETVLVRGGNDRALILVIIKM